MKVFFYVQHLLGIGHLRRAAAIARALEAEGIAVTLASGGMPVEGVRVLQLPPASSDAAFKQLFDERGKPVDEAWKRRRRDALLAAWRESRADALIVELFPFGRRQMRFELVPLLDAAKGKALVVCSVRDLIAARDPRRQYEILEIAGRYFDRVLVHGDPRVAPFETSFPLAPRLGGKLHYTGYVLDTAPEASAEGAGEVLVSVGGGAVGRRLLETSAAARPLTSLKDHTWRLLAGQHAADEDLAALRRLAGSGAVVERNRQDFTARLANCVLSVSQAGYNTVMETLRARARAVLVPFAGSGETEQPTRARLLAARGLVEVVEETALGAASLAAAIERALARPRPAAGDIDLGGAAASARLMRNWLS